MVKQYEQFNNSSCYCSLLAYLILKRRKVVNDEAGTATIGVTIERNYSSYRHNRLIATINQK
jgi:hypothetical protein